MKKLIIKFAALAVAAASLLLALSVLLVGCGGMSPRIERVGERVEFGTWRDAPITWKALAIEDGRALVISEDILTVRQYDDLGGSSHDDIDWDTASVTWAESDIRVWLNGDFLDTAFSKEEQEKINLSHLTNTGNPYYGTPGSEDTDDKVFFLSIEEAAFYASDYESSGYGEDDGSSITMTEEDVQYKLRNLKVWDYRNLSQAELAEEENYLRSDYLGQRRGYLCWLRSPGGDSGYYAATNTNGKNSPSVTDCYGVRPALWFNL